MAGVVDIKIYGLDKMLRDLKALPKEAQDELRTESKDIASRLMVPYWKAAAAGAGEPWAGAIQGSIRAKRDRIPTVSIGSSRQAFSKGASPTTVRYPSHAGPVGRAGAAGTMPATFGAPTGWMKAMGRYKGQALQEWLSAVDRIKRKFERG